MDDGVSISKVLEVVKVSNNGIGDNTRNQDNWYTIIKDIKDFDD